MIKGIVKFWDLGRSKAKGTFKVNVRTEEEFNQVMYREFSKHLISRNIAFNGGTIFAGFQAVGKFEFIAVGTEEKD